MPLTDQTVDIFVHVPKSAGSTVRSVISREYGVDRVIYFEEGSPAWQAHHSGAQSLSAQVDAANARLVTGHHAFGLHALIDRPTRYFAAIREPVSRLISHHTAVIARPRYRQHEKMNEQAPTIGAFFANPDLARGDQLANMLSGRGGEPDSVATAIRNIRERFAVVMLAERFDESLLFLARDLGWDVPLYRYRNVAPTNLEREARIDALAGHLRETYGARFAPDFAVYAEADRALSERIAAAGPPFAAALAAFEEMTQAINLMDPAGIHYGYIFRVNDPLPEGAERFIGSAPYRVVQEFLAGSA